MPSLHAQEASQPRSFLPHSTMLSAVSCFMLLVYCCTTESAFCVQDCIDPDQTGPDHPCIWLKADVHVQAARADYLLCTGNTLAAYKLCCSVFRQDRRATECLNVHLACLVELGKKNELFQLGHR
jgi:hypothetical protein